MIDRDELPQPRRPLIEPEDLRAFVISMLANVATVLVVAYLIRRHPIVRKLAGRQRIAVVPR